MYWSIKGPKVSVEWLASKPTLAILVCIWSSIEAHHRKVSSEGECPVILALTKSSTLTFTASNDLAWHCFRIEPFFQGSFPSRA